MRLLWYFSFCQSVNSSFIFCS